MKANLPIREKEIISFWEKIDIYKKLLQNNKNKQKFILHDGPPYANGMIHIGHALNRILKDIIIKYESMKGHYTPFIPGWDCHGLPIEYQLLKELGIEKKEIDKIKFRKKAAKFAEKFVEIQKKDFIRLGTFADWENPYLTLTPEYESSIIRVFKELVCSGYIYRKKKPIYWCPHCETALAEAEVEYADHISPSIYVKFPLKANTLIDCPSIPRSAGPRGFADTRNDTPKACQPRADNADKSVTTSVLIWTTTPWTLPANVALIFHPEEKYITVKLKTENLIIAEKLLESVVDKLKITEYEIGKTFKGRDLEGIKCQNGLVDRESVGILAEFVSMEEGTGVVHSAPGHGIEDYQIGLKYNLPVIAPVDNRGIFTDEVPEFAGHEVFEANSLIITKLKEKGYLLGEEKITHSYPHCWRCKQPIIFRATEQWFLNIEHDNLRQKILNSINTVKWIPAYGKNRISSMVELRPDWCLSRQRYWGVPIPVVYCDKCNKPLLDKNIIEKIEKIVAAEGSDAWFIHPVEEFVPSGLKCSCGSNQFRKEQDILDVWFDSGVSHEAVLKTNSELRCPCDMYLEGSDQHRGWFQTSLIPAIALHNLAPYKSVLTHGFVVDGEGQKMSKSIGNVIAPQEIVQKYGADILRLWVSNSDYNEDVRISMEIIDRLVETYRKIRNTIRFMLGNVYDFDKVKDRVEYDKLLEIDKYMLHRLQGLIENVTKSYENYQFHLVSSEINNFCIVELSNFYFDILKDRLYTFPAKSIERRAAQTVLSEILEKILCLIAPFLSFTAEEAWSYWTKTDTLPLRAQVTGTGKSTNTDSVFLENYPEVNKKYVSQKLSEDWKKILDLRNKVNLHLEQARKTGLIRSSLEAKIILSTNDEKTYNFIEKAGGNIVKSSERNNWTMIFIVSQAEIKLDKTSSDLDISEMPVRVKVVHADGQKCLRCWNWSTDIDENSLCNHCRKVIKL